MKIQSIQSPRYRIYIIERSPEISLANSTNFAHLPAPPPPILPPCHPDHQVVNVAPRYGYHTCRASNCVQYHQITSAATSFVYSATSLSPINTSLFSPPTSHNLSVPGSRPLSGTLDTLQSRGVAKPQIAYALAGRQRATCWTAGTFPTHNLHPRASLRACSQQPTSRAGRIASFAHAVPSSACLA